MDSDLIGMEENLGNENVLHCSHCNQHTEHITVYVHEPDVYKKFDSIFDEKGQRKIKNTTLVYWRGELLECPSCHSLLLKRKTKFKEESEYEFYDILPFKQPWQIDKLVFNEDKKIPVWTYVQYQEAVMSFNQSLGIGSIVMIKETVDSICRKEKKSKKELCSIVTIDESRILDNRIKKRVWLDINESLINVQKRRKNSIVNLDDMLRKEIKQAIRALELILCEIYLSDIEKYTVLKEIFKEFNIRSTR